MARDRPSPYVKGRRFFTVARGPVPRERWIARTILRPGGLSYEDIAGIETGRSLLLAIPRFFTCQVFFAKLRKKIGYSAT